MGALAKARRLRGGVFDLFRYTTERKAERQLIVDYESQLDDVAAGLTPENHATAIELLALPEMVRGFGPVKMKNISVYRERSSELMAEFKRQ
jgi:indolepyruvate ferredoxin oxidoreductase